MADVFRKYPRRMMISTRRFVLPDALLQRSADLAILSLLALVDFGEVVSARCGKVRFHSIG